MKKILTHIVLLSLCAGFMTFAVPSAFAIETRETPPAGETTPTVKPKATPPIPFRPDDPEVEQALKEAETKISGVEFGDQKVPVFTIATSGMRFVITALFFTAGPIALSVIVYSAVMLIIKPEDEEKVSRIKRTLIFSGIGLLVMALAYAIVQNIITLF